MTNVEKPRAGRPPIEPEDRRTKLLRVLTTEGEREELNRAAQMVGLDVSTWVRAVALERARRNEAAVAGAVQKARRSGPETKAHRSPTGPGRPPKRGSARR